MKIINTEDGGYLLQKREGSFTLTLDEAHRFNEIFDRDCEQSAVELDYEMDIKNKIVDWINDGDTGYSSQTLWSVMMGIEFNGASIPYDVWDFGRCHRLLMLVNEKVRKKCLKDAALKYPRWVPFEREWDNLTRLFIAGKDEEFKELIKSLS
ncbi:MAG: hypothetical protein ABIH42_08425 [Planctomycetota bacterium]